MKQKFKLKINGRMIVFLLLFVILGVSCPTTFLRASNFASILLNISLYGIMTCGMTFPALIAGPDLSVGGMVCISSAIFVRTILASDGTMGGLLLGAVFALIVAAAFGCLHGVFVHYFRMPSFLVTLSLQYILFGAGQLVTGSKILMCTKPDFILTLGNGNLFGIATPVYVFAVIAIVLYLLLNKTVFGRKVFAVGGNKSASALCGICVPRITILAYIVSSVCACLAGILLSAINQQATPAAGNGYEGEVLLCIVMGGTIMGTGIGSMGGALYGTLFIGLLNNGMRLLGIPSHYQTLIKGSLIVIAVAIDVYSNNRAATAGFYRKKENVENKGGTQSGND